MRQFSPVFNSYNIADWTSIWQVITAIFVPYKHYFDWSMSRWDSLDLTHESNKCFIFFFFAKVIECISHGLS